MQEVPQNNSFYSTNYFEDCFFMYSHYLSTLTTFIVHNTSVYKVYNVTVSVYREAAGVKTDTALCLSSCKDFNSKKDRRSHHTA